MSVDGAWKSWGHGDLPYCPDKPTQFGAIGQTGCTPKKLDLYRLVPDCKIRDKDGVDVTYYKSKLDIPKIVCLVLGFILLLLIMSVITRRTHKQDVGGYSQS